MLHGDFQCYVETSDAIPQHHHLRTHHRTTASALSTMFRQQVADLSLAEVMERLRRPETKMKSVFLTGNRLLAQQSKLAPGET